VKNSLIGEEIIFNKSSKYAFTIKVISDDAKVYFLESLYFNLISKNALSILEKFYREK